MTSKERVRLTMERKKPDRVPAAFEAVGDVADKLIAHYGLDSYEALLEKFQIDIIVAEATYIGPQLKSWTEENGDVTTQNFWGYNTTTHRTKVGNYGVVTKFPLKGLSSIEGIEANYKFPDPDWFDYSSITKTCEENPDKAVIFGHEGPFQIVTYLMEMDEFFMLMIDEPEVAQYILDKMNQFEVEYYRRCFMAGNGKLDILRTHDDYGTQISMLFSLPMWQEFFKENTRKLADLSHEFGGFFQQHSCGAVSPIIPDLIECGVDALEPIQKVDGLEAETLKELYDGQITFHGGVDTQWLLPTGTPQEVKAYAEHFMKTLGENGGYILMASQGFESDVPIENIEAVYTADRYQIKN